MPESFSDMSEYYDFFFKYIEEKNPYDYRKFGYTEAELAKITGGEKMYYFVDGIEKGYKKLYYPVVSDSWEFEDIILYDNDSPIFRSTVWFCYSQNDCRIVVKYSYLDPYEMDNKVMTDDEGKVTGNPTLLLDFVCSKEAWLSEKEYKKLKKNWEYREFQLKDRTVNAKMVLDERRQTYDIDFIYDDLCVSVWNIEPHLVTDDFLKDLAFVEYVHSDITVEGGSQNLDT